MGATVKMVLDRNHTVRSTLGHMITFKKGVPTDVVAIMVRSCAEIGAKRVDGEASLSPPADRQEMTQPVDPSQRLDDVAEAIERIVERNNIEDFTAGGTPKTPAVSKEVGYKVDQTEVNRGWKARNEKLAAADEG